MEGVGETQRGYALATGNIVNEWEGKRKTEKENKKYYNRNGQLKPERRMVRLIDLGSKWENGTSALEA